MTVACVLKAWILGTGPHEATLFTSSSAACLKLAAVHGSQRSPCCPQAQRRLAGRRGRASPQALLLYLDSQLAAVGMLDSRFTLLRNCTFLLLDVPPPPPNGTPGSVGEAGGAAAASTDDGAADAAVETAAAALYPGVARVRGVVKELSQEFRQLRARQLRTQVGSVCCP